ncbi:hypothetical protein yc1106_05250 [Curvularia clavata]|uniref:Linalool dehydratase/isomerase domain-containing protein n=1 Tax=Curvularia clavata TaxID=95742 RepID=A0A9Q9DU13_CURCL|nr:hypothetical protein yc1106_05250 [Curvularia clavata]
MATSTTAREMLNIVGPRDTNVEGSSLPIELPEDFLSGFPKLTKEQAGHIRHFHNLAFQPDGEWHHMGTQDPGQEWLDAYRYQLATMAYAAGSAHYHRLPALRSLFKPLLEQLIHKMLRREVWGYWYLTSQSGKFVDPDLTEMRKPWADPIKQENIMYSGHLLLMVSLHAMLFDDDKYDQPEALTFHWDPIFWGFGPEKFTYTRSTLEEVILAEMERHNWKGIIAMRYNDVRNGTAIVDNVLKNYVEAWEKSGGFLQDDKFVINSYMVKQGRTIPGGIGFTACWNSQLIHSLFTDQSVGFFTKVPGGRVNVNDQRIANLIRNLVKSEGADPQAWSTKEKAQELAKDIDETPKFAFLQPAYGYIAQWASEVADSTITDGLMRHADEFHNPLWERGGLFYPRNDTLSDSQGNWKFMDPYTGNAAIAYARLNVPDGQRKMWEKPWSKEHFSDFPFVDGISLASDVDFLRGNWDSGKGAFVVSMQTWDGSKKDTGSVPISRSGSDKQGHKMIEEPRTPGINVRSLKASSIDLGIVTSEGYVAENQVVMDRLTMFNLFRPLSTREVLALLDYVCNPDLPASRTCRSQIVTGFELPADIESKGRDIPNAMEQPFFRNM